MKKLKDDKWSVRVLAAFEALRLETYADLATKSREDFSRLTNFGNKSMREIRARLAENGLALAGETVALRLANAAANGGAELSAATEEILQPALEARRPDGHAPRSIRYKHAGEPWRVDRFDLMLAEYEFAGESEPEWRWEVELFHATLMGYSRQWLICQRLYGIGPVVLPPEARAEDFRPLGPAEVAEMIGIDLSQLQAELEGCRMLWRGAAANAVPAETLKQPKDSAPGTAREWSQRDHSHLMQTSQGAPAHAQVAETAGVAPLQSAEVQCALLQEFGFDPEMFEFPSRSAERNALERSRFVQRMLDFDKELREPKARGLAHDLLLNELYMDRLDVVIQKLTVLLHSDSTKSNYHRDLNQSINMKNEIQTRYMEQLANLDDLFPWRASVGGKASFKAVVSDMVTAVRDHYATSDNALADKIMTAGEVQMAFRQSVQAPEPAYRLGQRVFILEAIHPSNLFNPAYRSQLHWRTLKKLDALGKRLIDEARREIDEELVDLEQDGKEGEYHEFRE